MSVLNSAKSVKALINPAQLKLGEMLILEFFNCPAALGNFNDMLENGFACWLLEQPRQDIFKLSRNEAFATASEWLDTLTFDELKEKVNRLCEGISAFYKSFPKSEEAQKKTLNEETD